GMQLFFENSEESKGAKGLSLIKGNVKKFNLAKDLKIPHIGWNQITGFDKKCPLLKGVPEGSSVYFCHSYYPAPKDKAASAAFTEYGIKFSSLVWQENVFGTQFHPEKSQKVGLGIIENFVKL
ncbi:MAG: imidazole glycerol phosphate synthase subunit HisH, partial [Candidatus Omnitrophica bacterium]|nr:imidazole glycerol phosphate synthase subunit HisH [Candidatus Omnitrophota bacterium]